MKELTQIAELLSLNEDIIDIEDKYMDFIFIQKKQSPLDLFIAYLYVLLFGGFCFFVLTIF